jgi:antitoxin ParD1/3/4
MREASFAITHDVLDEHRLANSCPVGYGQKFDHTAHREERMPTRTVKLTPEQDDFIDEVLKKGEYTNASEAVGDAIRTLQRRRAYDALKLERLRLSVQVGAAALERGDYADVDDTALDDYIDALAASPGKP